jgi:serine/threonine protein kinase
VGEGTGCNRNRYIEDDDYYTPEEVKENIELYKNEIIQVTEPIVNYQFGELIGKGCFGQVYRGLDLDTGRIIAIKNVPIVKFINKEKVDIRLAALEKEIMLLSSFEHPNIVKYLGHHNDGESLNIMLEYMTGGSISTLLNKYPSFNETLVKIYTKHILHGLNYLHAHNVIHGDIKGSNVLVDDNGVCKLADFGGSNRIMKEGDKRQRLVGTVQWMAPEVIRESKYDRFSDIWSLG